MFSRINEKLLPFLNLMAEVYLENTYHFRLLDTTEVGKLTKTVVPILLCVIGISFLHQLLRN